MRSHRPKTQRSSSSRKVESPLRIIGGELRRRTISYHGQPGLRPMKDRVREALFNLIGPDVQGKTVIDLFAGTGAVSFEALSRGARHAVLIERHFPSVRLIRESADSLGVTDRITIHAGDSFRWAERHLSSVPPDWLVFVCPPYDFYVARRAEMLELIRRIWDTASPGSVLIVEADQRFTLEALPDSTRWQVHAYPPAVLAIARRGILGTGEK
jgi:16S rRNA (guanine(966)-N(2))-methyltransferase RsmD